MRRLAIIAMVVLSSVLLIATVTWAVPSDALILRHTTATGTTGVFAITLAEPASESPDSRDCPQCLINPAGPDGQPLPRAIHLTETVAGAVIVSDVVEVRPCTEGNCQDSQPHVIFLFSDPATFPATTPSATFADTGSEIDLSLAFLTSSEILAGFDLLVQSDLNVVPEPGTLLLIG
jgi:hypothetical protein